MPDRRSAAGLAVAAMMLSSFALGAGLTLVPPWLPGACAWLAGLLMLPGLSRFQAAQAALMSAVGLACIGWAAAHGRHDWWSGLRDGNHAMLAMLAAVSFLRPVTATGVAGEALPRGRRAVLETLAATHLFGAVINISAPVLVGERIAGSRMSPLQAKTVSRAFVAASMWSPFFIAMALILHYLPGARLPVMSAIGFATSTTLMLFCAWTLPRDPAAAEFTGFPLHWQALWTPLLLSACVLAGHALLPALSVLVLIEGAALGVVLGVLLLRHRREAGAILGGHVRERLPDMRGEVAMFLSAAVMTAGIGSAVGLVGLDLAPAQFGAGAAATMLAALIALAVIGVHPVVSISVLASLWPLERYDGNLVGAVFLLAWGLGLVISPFSGTSLVFQGRFGLRTTDLLRWNLAYVAVGYAVGVGILWCYAAR
jgi:hypothetical protein